MRTAVLSLSALVVTTGCGQTATTAPKCAEGECHVLAHETIAETLAVAGVPHTATIDAIALSPDGRAALTRDRRGGARLWTSLDGTTEPVPLPMGAIATMSVDASGDAIAIAVVDTSGAAQLMTYDGADFTHEASLPPHAGIRAVEVTAAGRRAIALGNDGSVRLYTLKGDELDRWQPRGGVSDLLVSANPARAVAVSRDAAVATRLAVSENFARLRVLDDAIALELSPGDRAGAPFALSDDGAVLAYVTGGRDEAYAMWLHHLDTGARDDTFLPISIDSEVTLGFTGPRDILAGDRTSRSVWRFDVATADIDAVELDAHAHEAVVPAYGAGLRVGARSTWLMVHSLDDSSTRYLGYDAFRPRRAAIAPNNGFVAWAAERSVFIESLGGVEQRVHLDQSTALDGTLSGLFFYDEDHLIEVGTAGQLLFVSWRTGEVIDAIGTRTMHAAAHYDRSAEIVEVYTPDGPLAFGVDPNLGFVRLGGEPRIARAPTANAIEMRGRVVRRVAAPTGNAFALVRSDGFVDVYEGPRTRAWSHSSGDTEASAVEWAPDASSLAIAGSAGAAVVDARDGSIVHKRCATHFRVRSIVMGGHADDAPASICE